MTTRVIKIFKHLFLLLTLLGLLGQTFADTNNPMRPPTEKQNTWWANAVGYQIFVRSFQDSNGDGIGDFKGATSRLDYLKNLGINLIWLMPVYPSPSYHGYDVTDEQNINPDYGTLEDFDDFLNQAHKRGIRVILDFVPNHVASNHPWFLESKNPDSPKRDWFLWRDQAPNWKKPWGEIGTVWHSSGKIVVFPGTIQSVLGGKDWNPAGNETRATETQPGVFEFVAQLPAGRYEYKVAIGGSWGENYGSQNKPDGPNIVLEIKEPQIVRFVFDANNRRLQDSVNNPEEIKPPSVVPPTNTAPAEKPSFYYGAFWAGMPDLNWRNQEVETAMNMAAKFWLDRGADGFRLDAIRYVVEPNDNSANGNAPDGPDNILWAKKFTNFVKSIKPDAMLIGEIWTDSETIAKYTNATNGELMAFNFSLQRELLQSTQLGNSEGIKRELAKKYSAKAVDGLFISNHDQNRPVFFNAGRYLAASNVLLTLPGQPFIYYGQELGMPNSNANGDEGKRAPMRWNENENAGFSTGKPWSLFAGDPNKNSVAAQNKDKNSLLHHYQNLIRVRQKNIALRIGGYQPIETNERILGFIRNSKEQNLLVFINLDSDPQTTKVNLANTIFKNNLSAKNISTHKTIQLQKPIKLGPYELQILELQK